MNPGIHIHPWTSPLYYSDEDEVLPDDYFPDRSSIKFAEQILRPANEESHIDAVNFFWSKIEDFDIDDMFSFVQMEVDPLLLKVVGQRDHQLIKLSLFVCYFFKGRPSDFFRKMFDAFLERVQNEFKEYPFSYWMMDRFTLLFKLNVKEEVIVQVIAYLFLGKMQDDCETNLDLLLDHPDSIKRSRFFYRMIQFIINSKNEIDWTSERIERFCQLLSDQAISFEECLEILSQMNLSAIQKIALEKISACQVIDSEKFIFLITELLPILKNEHKKSLLDLSQREIICDLGLQKSLVNLFQCLSEPTVNCFKIFFEFEDESIKLKAYQNFMKSILYHWDLRLEAYTFVWEEDLQRWDFSMVESLLNCIQQYTINNSFSYLSFSKKNDILISIERIHEMMAKKQITHPTLLSQIGRTFCIDESWTLPAIFLFTYDKTDPKHIVDSVSLFLEKLISGEDNRFKILASLKENMQETFFINPQEQSFVVAFFEVLIKYVQHPNVELSKELSDRLIKELKVIFQSTQINFMQRFWVADFLRSKDCALTTAETQIFLKGFIAEKKPFSNNELIKALNILTFSEINSLEDIDLEIVKKITNIKFFFENENSTKEQGIMGLKNSTDNLYGMVWELYRGFLHMFKIWKIEEKFLIPVYRNFIEVIWGILQKNQVNFLQKTRLKSEKKGSSLVKKLVLQSLSVSLFRDIRETLEFFKEEQRALGTKYSEFM